MLPTNDRHIQRKFSYPENLFLILYADLLEETGRPSKEQLERLLLIISTLEKKHQDLIHMRYKEKLTYDQIAKRLNIVSHTAAMTQMGRVKYKLRHPKYVAQLRYVKKRHKEATLDLIESC